MLVCNWQFIPRVGSESKACPEPSGFQAVISSLPTGLALQVLQVWCLMACETRARVVMGSGRKLDSGTKGMVSLS